MAKYKKFYIDDKTYRSENKAYEEVNRNTITAWSNPKPTAE